MTNVLCSSPICSIPGLHTPTCYDGQCRGCLPSKAQDGLMLCRRHVDLIAIDAIESGRLWSEIGLVLTRSGEKDAGSAENPHPGLALVDQCVQARTLIRQTITSWVRWICDERGISYPHRDDVIYLGALMAKHHVWLAGQTDAAGGVSVQLADARRIGRRAAYPEGLSTIKIGSCPEYVSDQRCPGIVTAYLRRVESLLPATVVCSVDSTHEWTSTRWRELGLRMETMWESHVEPTTIAAAYRASMSTVYRMARAHEWRRVSDGRRVRYDIRDVRSTMDALTFRME